MGVPQRAQAVGSHPIQGVQRRPGPQWWVCRGEHDTERHEQAEEDEEGGAGVAPLKDGVDEGTYLGRGEHAVAIVDRVDEGQRSSARDEQEVLARHCGVEGHLGSLQWHTIWNGEVALTKVALRIVLEVASRRRRGRPRSVRRHGWSAAHELRAACARDRIVEPSAQLHIGHLQ
jgi:hypothetical protein